jgi:hypothetical protein
MVKDSRSQTLQLIEGAYDLHVHTSPSHYERSLDDFELVKEATALGMSGVLVKNHFEPTSARAALVNRYMKGGAKLYGSITLNLSVGGINPYAVESAVRLGAKMVWMPTKDSQNSINQDGIGDFRLRDGLTVFNDDGSLKTCVYEVMEVARQYNVCLSTGHLTTEESFSVCKAGLDLGVQMILTHPEFSHTTIPLDLQLKFVDMGVIIEKDWVNIALGMTTTEEMAKSIKLIGADNIYLATDRGQASGERPSEGLILFVENMLNHGITPEEIRTMICTVPKVVLRE